MELSKYQSSRGARWTDEGAEPCSHVFLINEEGNETEG